MPEPQVAKIREANAIYAEHFHDPSLPTAPSRHLAILTCMDSRIDVFQMAGLHLGEAHIIRNAGGRATEDAIRSLLISHHLLGTNVFVVVHHTRCGLHMFSNEEINNRIGGDPNRDWLAFDDLYVSVAEDVAKIRNCQLLPQDVPVFGFIYDVDTGQLIPVVDR